MQESMELSTEPPTLPEAPASLLYCEAKMLSPGYQVCAFLKTFHFLKLCICIHHLVPQAAKKCLFEAFENAKLGKWIKKPQEQDEFCCEIVDADPKHLFA